jgi:hypothetical protein
MDTTSLFQLMTLSRWLNAFFTVALNKQVMRREKETPFPSAIAEIEQIQEIECQHLGTIPHELLVSRCGE